MHDINLDPNCMPNFSYLQALEEESYKSSGAIGSQPCMSGVSVQTLESHLPNYVSQSDAVQNNAYSVNPLNPRVVAASTSESNFISTYNLVNFPPDELDVYLGPKETAPDELISTELNPPTDTSNPLQGTSCGKTSVNFSQSSPRPVAIVNPQQEAQTEVNSVNQLLRSSKHKTALAEYEKTPARKAAYARYIKTPAGKAALARAQKKYVKTVSGKAAIAKYEQSPAGKAAKAKYRKSAPGKAAEAKYEKSPARKAARAIHSARTYAYNKELVKSGNKEIAKQKVKKQLRKKDHYLKTKV